jgi:transposase
MEARPGFRRARVFERGDCKRPEIDEEQVKELHPKIGELAVAKSFLERKLKPWGGKWGAV